MRCAHAIKKYLIVRKKPTYWLTRFVLLRILGFVYFFAFLSLALQVIPLLGSQGILPASAFLNTVESRFGEKDAFFLLPSLFWTGINDTSLLAFAWIGVLLSLVVFFGYANSIIMLSLWILYSSYVHIGQLFYGYGWEIQLIETGFLAMFLVPLLDARPFPKRPAPLPIIWLFRWLAFRIHLGSGLIKLRGDGCWRNLTCLYSHYETQPIPGPLSPWFHFMPKFAHKMGVLFDFFTQLILPWFSFGPQMLRHFAGFFMLLMQIILIFSGNLSFLNWLTIVPIIALFDDSFFSRILPRKLIQLSEKAEKEKQMIKWQTYVAWILVVLVAFLSIPVIKNLASNSQAMNTSFNSWDIVNTYGAFGAVGKERYELVIEGFDGSNWKEYEFSGKPTDVMRGLPQLAPYQPRIDWQIWFAAMSSPEREAWLLHFVWMLLHNDENAIKLLKNNPFPNEPPQYIRIQFYRYEFNKPWQKGAVWNRTFMGTWFGPVGKDTEGFSEFMRMNWG